MTGCRSLSVQSFATLLAVALVPASSARARPLGGFGERCENCHAGEIAFGGRELPNAFLDVLSDTHSQIPPGQYGDPDRGVGPLSSYTAVPGGSFELRLQVKEPDPLISSPLAWAAALHDIYTTDPDSRTNPDNTTWRDDALVMLNARADGNGSVIGDPYPLPTSAKQWTLHTDSSFLVPDQLGLQYYTSADTYGHAWVGPLVLSVIVNVPAGVLEGWYDLEASIAGEDDQGIFYDDEHFYLHVRPEPATYLLLSAGAVLLLRRRH